MATSGSFSGSIKSGNYKLQVDWSATQSVANNTSKITAVMYLVQASSWSLDINTRSDNSTTIAGTSHTWSSPAIDRKGGTTKLATVTSGNITHNTDGTKSVTISATFYIRATISGTYYEKITASQEVTLDTIPRATTPKLSASSVNMGSNVTISLDRASSSFTHDLAYQFAGGSWVSIATGVGTSRAWTVPDLAEKMPNASSGTVTLRCITKNGGTTVGTKTVSMTAKVPTTAAYQPTISAVTLTEATTGLATQFKAFIQSKSKVKAAITSSGAKGSTIEKVSTTFQGKTHTGSSWTSETLTASGTLSMTTKVTDSRGRTASKTTTFSVLAYSAPRVTKFDAYRVNDSGVQDTEGQYALLTYAYSVPSLNGGNTASLSIQYKASTASSWTDLATVASGAVALDTANNKAVFSSDVQYDMRIVVKDYFGAQSIYPATLPSGAVIVDILADGTGLGIGKVATLPGVCDIAMQTRFQGGMLYIEPLSGSDLNTFLTAGTYRLPSSSTYKNAPENSVGAMLEVMGLGTIIQRWTTASKTNPRTFERSYYGGSWGDWVRTYDVSVGTIYSGTKSVQITSTTVGVDTLNDGASVILPVGVYVVTANVTFNTGSSTGMRNNQIRLIAETPNAAGTAFDVEVLSRQRVMAAGANFAEMNISAVYEVTVTGARVKVQKSSSIAEDATAATSVKAVKIL